MRRTFLSFLWALALVGCPSETDPPDPVSDGAGADVILPDGVVPDDDTDGGEADTDEPECSLDSDCGGVSDCVTGAKCNDGVCEIVSVAAGSPCAIGCSVGTCDGFQECTNLVAKECAEKDGNTCTVPTCVVAPGPGAEDEVGTCSEIVIEDGEPPYASSECWDGAVCTNGEIDATNGTPTALAEECAAMGGDLDPLGCVGSYVCVGGDEKCRPVVKPNGTQCWLDEAWPENAECQGQACEEGVCVHADGFDETCGEDDYSPECDEGCQACTTLTCHWIDDPGGGPTRQSYCKPAADVGAECADDPCKVDQGCVFGDQADGPLGKETLGACGAGTDKTKEACLEDMGKPALSCLLAAVSCDAAEGGCVLEQDTADKWCWPAEGLCWEKDETYCSHLDSGDQWDAETGCNIAWVSLDCDDGNPCTIGQCKPQLSDFVCDQTLLSGMTCDDGDPCTVGGLCAAGICDGLTAKCGDDTVCNGIETCLEGDCTVGTALDCDDDNPCTDDACDPVTGCTHAYNTLTCDDGDPCTIGAQCDGGECLGSKPKCGDNDVCNGIESCDGSGNCLPGAALSCNDGDQCTDDNCDPLAGCSNPQNTAPCDDGNPCTLESVCKSGDCVLSVPNACDDDNPCTENLCDVISGCQNPAYPSGLPCPGGQCIKGECTCSPSCDGTSCGDDGCGATCACDEGVECVAGVCGGGTGGGDLDGEWIVTSTDPLWVTLKVDYVFGDPAVTGVANVDGIIINYSGTKTGDDWQVSATYNSGLSLHTEEWDCSFVSATVFVGTATDTFELLGFPFSLAYDITGNKL